MSVFRSRAQYTEPFVTAPTMYIGQACECVMLKSRAHRVNDQKLVLPTLRTVAVWAGMAFIMAVAIWIRLSIADGESVWRDEAQTVAIASQRFPSGILEALRRDGNSPLFYLVEHFFVSDRLAPHRELQDRALSVILGLLLIPVAFAAAWRLSDGSAAAALAAATAAAFSPVLVDLSTQVRPYAGVALATAVMAYSVAGLERSGKGWIAYTIGAAVGFYLHALFATTIAAFAVGTIVIAVRRHALRRWLFAHAVLFVVLVPGLLFLSQQVRGLTIAGGRIPWGTTPDLGRLFDQAGIVLTGSGGGSQHLLVVLVSVLLASTAVAASGAARRLILVAVVSLALSFLLAFRSGGFETRYHVGPMTLMLIGASTGAAVLVRRFRSAGLILTVGAVAMAGAANVRETLPESRLPRSSARQVATILGKARPSDAIVIVPDTVAVAVNYYLPPRHPQFDLPSDRRADMIDFRGWTERLDDPGRRNAFERFLRAGALRGERIWIVIWQPMVGPLPPLHPRDLERSALPAQWALGKFALGAVSGLYRPVATSRLVLSAEPMTVILCEPLDPPSRSR